MGRRGGVGGGGRRVGSELRGVSGFRFILCFYFSFSVVDIFR